MKIRIVGAFNFAVGAPRYWKANNVEYSPRYSIEYYGSNRNMKNLAFITTCCKNKYEVMIIKENRTKLMRSLNDVGLLLKRPWHVILPRISRLFWSVGKDYILSKDEDHHSSNPAGIMGICMMPPGERTVRRRHLSLVQDKQLVSCLSCVKVYLMNTREDWNTVMAL